MQIIHFIVEDKNGESQLRAERYPGSHVVGPVPFNLNDQKVKDYKKYIAAGIRKWKSLRKYAEDVGKALFSALIGSESVCNLYRDTLAQLETTHRVPGTSGEILHLQLTFERDSFYELPWELLFDSEMGSFLSTTDYISISRSPAQSSGIAFGTAQGSRCIQQWRPPLRLLVVLSTPALVSWPGSITRIEPGCIDTLAFARFLERLQQRYGTDLISYKLLASSEATLDCLHRELGYGYDVLYFVGHSYTSRGETFIILEKGDRIRHGIHLSASELGLWLRASGVRVVILSSCDSLAAATALSRLEYLDAVVGMQMEMPMMTGAAFDEAVIDALVSWQPLEKCILRGRREAWYVIKERTDEYDSWEATDRPDWAIPILFTRSLGRQQVFCPIPEGTYQLGLGESELEILTKQPEISSGLYDFVRNWIRPKKAVHLLAFQIGRWPVTNQQYRYFLEHSSENLRLPPGFERRGRFVHLINLNPSAPVVNVTWEEANAFCRWTGGRLPTADEWEVAARGPKGKLFPWGDEFDRELCPMDNDPNAEPKSVLHYERGASPFGVEVLCGNVFEWTATADGEHRLVVGSSWDAKPVHALPSFRCPRNPNERYSNVGFRCAM